MARDCKQVLVRDGVSYRMCGEPDESGADGKVRAYRGSQEVGSMEWSRGHRKVIIANVDVRPGGQRKGIGTTMYELVLAMTCEYKLQMASSSQRSVFGESFWKKQVKKGRARCAITNPEKSANYWAGPLNDLEERIAKEHKNAQGEPDYDFAVREMKKLDLPKPRRGSEGQYWPCRQYVLKKEGCKSGGSLRGARKKPAKCRYGKYTRGPRKGMCRTRAKR